MTRPSVRGVRGRRGWLSFARTTACTCGPCLSARCGVQPFPRARRHDDVQVRRRGANAFRFKIYFFIIQWAHTQFTIYTRIYDSWSRRLTDGVARRVERIVFTRSTRFRRIDFIFFFFVFDTFVFSNFNVSILNSNEFILFLFFSNSSIT